MSKSAIGLTERERLLTNFQTLRVLGAFVVPRTTAEVAGIIGEPASRIGHRVRQLRRAGLLVEVSRQGRRSYLQVAKSNYELHCRPELLSTTHKHIDETLGRLGQLLKERMERQVLNDSSWSDQAFVRVTLEETGLPLKRLPPFVLMVKPLSPGRRKRLEELFQELQQETEEEGPKAYIGFFAIELEP